jgi:hypothetical protein
MPSSNHQQAKLKFIYLFISLIKREIFTQALKKLNPQILTLCNLTTLQMFLKMSSQMKTAALFYSLSSSLPHKGKPIKALPSLHGIIHHLVEKYK